MSASYALSSIDSSLSSTLGLSVRKKVSSREEIFAAQEAREQAKEVQVGDAKTEFVKVAKMSPAERMRAAYLKSHNLTEESLAALPREEREKIEEEIKQEIKRKLGWDEHQKTGVIADVSV